MGFSAYVINVISAVIAVEYIDYGFPKKYSGFRRWGVFAVGCVAYFLTVTALNRYRKGKIEAQCRRESEQERLEGLMDMYRVGREINHWRHDMQGKLDILYRMQKNGKYTEVEAHMGKLCSELRDYPELPQPTGNEGLDAALIKMIPKCRERGIHFCYVIMGKAGQIDSIVLGNILDNLLCNGMEACQNLSGSREMELVIRSRIDGLEIYLENSIGESVLEKNPQLVSHKREQERHGFGMESICCIVEKYEGIYEYWEEKKAEDSRFCQHLFELHIAVEQDSLL